MATNQRAELGYTRDQFFRRVQWLTKEREITPTRGFHNKLLLSNQDWTLLTEFKAIEDSHKDDEWGLNACLQELRLQRERKESAKLRGAIISTEAHNRGLQKALMRLLGRRRWVRKVAAWFKSRVLRTSKDI